MDKQYLKRVAIYSAAILFSLFMVVYIGYHVHHALTSDVVTEPAREVTRSSVIRADAYLFRDEYVLGCTNPGTHLADFPDGTHVFSGSSVASVYSGTDDSVEASVRSLNEQLLLLSGYNTTNRGPRNTAAIEERIYSLMLRLKKLSQNNDFAGIPALQSELLCELNQRNASTVSGEASLDTAILSVNEKIASEKTKLGSVVEKVYAPIAGWYYSETDGYEGSFSTESINSLTVDGFDALAASPAKNAGTTAGKLVTRSRWYIAMKVGASELSTLSEGDFCDVEFSYSGGDSLEMRVSRIVTDPDSAAALLILTSCEMRSGFPFTRTQSVTVTADSLKGFAVPRSAIRMVDGVLGVYVFDGVYASFRRIERLRDFDDVCMVKTDTAIEAAMVKAGETPVYWNEAAYRKSRRKPKNEDEAKAIEQAKKVNEGLDPIKDAPYLSQNDLIITEGTGIYHGRIYS